MIVCSNCGAQDTEGTKFCRQCGTRLETLAEEATTWRLQQPTARGPKPAQPTTPVSQSQTAESAHTTGAAYIPPVAYHPATTGVEYKPPPVPGQVEIALGEWLSQGWRVYSQNWALMSVATLFASLLSLCTLGILAGPTLMGLYRMAFRTMRGEMPEMSDLFKWKGRFLQAFLAFLIPAAIHFGFTGASEGGLLAILAFLIDPVLAASLGLTMPLILERKKDVVAAINDVGRLVFSRDAFMWWLVGLVIAAISALGSFACLIGVFVTVPWMVSSTAVAYRDLFGLDDPNRTQP